MYVDLPTTIYYKNSDLSLCSIEAQAKNAAKMAKGTEILIREHSGVWKDKCPKQYFKYLNAAVMYNLISRNKKKARIWVKVLLKENPRSIKSWVFLLFLLMPKSAMVRAIILKNQIKERRSYSINKLKKLKPKFILADVLCYSGISYILLKLILFFKPTSYIFMYHRLNNGSNGLFKGVDLDNFRDQLKLLKRFFKIADLSKFCQLINSVEASNEIAL